MVISKHKRRYQLSKLLVSHSVLGFVVDSEANINCSVLRISLVLRINFVLSLGLLLRFL